MIENEAKCTSTAIEISEKISQIKEEIIKDNRIDGGALMAILEIFSKYDV